MSNLCRTLWVSLLAAWAGMVLTVQGQAGQTVSALRETPPVDAQGDAADDPAIWYDAKTGLVRIIGTQKKGGLYVYDLDGQIVQSLAGGRPNNVDLRPWAGGAIAATSDRADNTIVLWRLKSETGLLDPAPLVRLPTGFEEVYGICLGLKGQDLIAIATSKAGGVGVWALETTDGGQWAGRRIAEFALGSISEGCVVDDPSGVAYVAEETVGIWRFDLTDAKGAGRHLIDRVKPVGRLAADVEGLAIWRRGAKGYLAASVQGESRFAVYGLEHGNPYRGTFRIGPSSNADGVSGTDGIDIHSGDLGPQFSAGLMVVQDDVNSAPKAAQNFKYVSWADVQRALGIEN